MPVMDGIEALRNIKLYLSNKEELKFPDDFDSDDIELDGESSYPPFTIKPGLFVLSADLSELTSEILSNMGIQG